MTRRSTGYQNWEREAAKQTVLIHRAQQAIEILMECNGFTPLTKSEFADQMARTHGTAWLDNGKPNRRLVELISALSKDQFLPGNETAASQLGGYVIGYSPTKGGMTLLDANGEMQLDHMLHLLSGDLLRQKNIITVNRRRLTVWKAVAKQAIGRGHVDLGLLAGQIQNEIDRTGFVSEKLASEFLVAAETLGIAS